MAGTRALTLDAGLSTKILRRAVSSVAFQPIPDAEAGSIS
jgi:hypothetical protein